MDTNISEIKQEAATSADLLQQKTPVEIIEQKSSVASSDEERLDAGISTIGLQAKRLSGAQRKRLMRERKMREGTWTEKKPPRKTPSPWDKGAVGSSGVCEKTSIRLKHTISGKTATEKTQDHSRSDWVVQASCNQYQDGDHSQMTS
jgi:hypothetical protein